MSTVSAAQTPRTPQSAHETTASAGDEHDEGDHHRQGEVRAVARADQDPVEREHGAVERLHQCEQRPEQSALREHLGVRCEDSRDHVAERRERRARTPAPTATESPIIRTLAANAASGRVAPSS